MAIMTNALLLKSIPYEEFDYQTLLDAVHGYARPRMKISAMLAKGDIVRVKKGLYILGEPLRRHPFCRELLANLIYGPSYISLDYALHYHGLIPERAETVTSVTCGRSRSFDTPIGTFSYRRITLDAFRTGMDRVELDDGRSFLIAVPEKALADRVIADRGAGLSTQKALHDYLLANLRMAPADLAELDPSRLAEIARLYRSRRVKLLADLVSRLGKGYADA
jgi:predicted transcriptional regulator of viral defense system